MQNSGIILGGGVTGLAAGMVSGLPVFEARQNPGGICCSYYVRPGEKTRLPLPPDDGEVYRFEIGGGHWIFGGDPLVLRFIRELTGVSSYQRESSVFFPESGLRVPYPLQNNLRFLDPLLARSALEEIVDATKNPTRPGTMGAWLHGSFGPTLCEKFFEPFHDLYTAGLWKEIAPQDSYKSPVNTTQMIRGYSSESSSVGYNVSFLYPPHGLDDLTRKMGRSCDIRYGKTVVGIDLEKKRIRFSDGSEVDYPFLISTLPLNRMVDMTGLKIDCRTDPHTSVLVTNIGAIRGPNCPEDQWLYVPRSKARFHRVGFYSNVDVSFLPSSTRNRRDRVSIYVERAYQPGQRPDPSGIDSVSTQIVEELREWGWTGDVEVVDPTWIDVAYTWSWPDSQWKIKAMRALENHGIFQVGRYARWIFQGIADSIRDGFIAGAAAMRIDSK